jgi:hypothetical protein
MFVFTRASAVSQMIPQSHWHRWIHFRGLIEATEPASAVSLRPPNPLPRSHWDRRSQSFFRHSFCWKLPFCVEIMVLKFFFMDSAVSFKSSKLLLRSHWSRRRHFRCLIETIESASAASLKPLKQTIWNDYREFLGNFEAIWETALARESGP